jgi:subtilisin family serine protease
VTTVSTKPPALARAGGSIAIVAVMLVAGCGASATEPSTIAATKLAHLAWHLAALDADPGRTTGRGTGQTIAFLDTGFDADVLGSFAGRVVSPWNVLSLNSAVSDPNGHGTAMAVIAAGGGDDAVWGVAPAARVMPITVADRYGHADPAGLAAGIVWAIDHRATVINISLASLVPTAEVADEVAKAIAAGIPVVAAAGDIGSPGPEFPASEAGVLAVYGQDRTGEVGVHSNLPEGNGVLAPGEAIESLVPGNGLVKRMRVNGTSAAAAVVSGVVAACLSMAATSRSIGVPSDKLCVASLVVRPPSGFMDLAHILEEVA